MRRRTGGHLRRGTLTQFYRTPCGCDEHGHPDGQEYFPAKIHASPPEDSVSIVNHPNRRAGSSPINKNVTLRAQRSKERVLRELRCEIRAFGTISSLKVQDTALPREDDSLSWTYSPFIGEELNL